MQKSDLYVSVGTRVVASSIKKNECVRNLISEMTREYVLVWTDQFKLPLILLNLKWRYALMLILQKWMEQVWVITVFKEIYAALKLI